MKVEAALAILLSIIAAGLICLIIENFSGSRKTGVAGIFLLSVAAGFAVAPEVAIYSGILFGIFAVAFLYSAEQAISALRQTASEMSTAASNLIGERVLVVEEIDNGHGKVDIDGDLWAAKSLQHIKPGTPVRLIRIDGPMAIVAVEGKA